jgi:hypothetical protein
MAIKRDLLYFFIQATFNCHFDQREKFRKTSANEMSEIAHQVCAKID